MSYAVNIFKIEIKFEIYRKFLLSLCNVAMTGRLISSSDHDQEKIQIILRGGAAKGGAAILSNYEDDHLLSGDSEKTRCKQVKALARLDASRGQILPKNRC
jgi:hypothetical protein